MLDGVGLAEFWGDVAERKLGTRRYAITRTWRANFLVARKIAP